VATHSTATLGKHEGSQVARQSTLVLARLMVLAVTADRQFLVAVVDNHLTLQVNPATVMVLAVAVRVIPRTVQLNVTAALARQA
jgi:hypothetical protein